MTSLVLVLALAAPASAQEPPPAYETTVTALRFPRPLPDVPTTVTVLPREELDRTPALAADDMVRLAPAAATFRRTPALVADPTSQGVNLRGVGPSGVSRAVVLLDGIPINDPFGGWVYWRAQPRLGIERIEVAPGGTSALYGNYGLGGSVQLVSRPIADRLEADAAYGSPATASATAHAAGRLDRVGGALDLDWLRSDGYAPVHPDQRGAVDTSGGSRHLTGAVRAEVEAGAGWRLGARAIGFDERQNGGTALTTADVRTGLAAVSADREGERGDRLQLAAHGSIERFAQVRARIAPMRASEAIAAEQRVPSAAQGASAVWTSRDLQGWGAHRLVAGADVRRVQGEARELLSPPMVAPASVVRRESGGEQRFAGAFVEEVWSPLPVLDVAVAGRLDAWWNVDGRRELVRGDGGVEQTRFPDRSAVEVSPRVGLLARPTPRLRLRGSAYRAFRAPTLNELYRPFQVGTVTTAANEALRAERLVGGELGVERLVGEAGSLRLCGFWNVFDDPVVNATLPGEGAGRQRQNLGRARVRGVEASADVRVGRLAVLGAGYTLADSRVLEAPDHPELVGKRLPQDPVHRARVAAALTHRWALLSAQARLQSGQFEDDLNELPMGGYAVIDLFVAAPVAAGLSAFLSVQNLLDQRYLVGRAGVDTVGPPRIALAGLRLR